MKRKRTKTKRKGFVVVVVLAILMMLTVLLLGFNYKSRLCLQAADHFKKSKLALNSARAGLNIAIAAIGTNDDIFTNKTLQSLFSPEHTFDIAEAVCSVTINQENSKLNVNLLTDKNDKPDRTAIEQLLRLIDLLNQKQIEHPHIGYGIVPAIIDWTDADDQVAHLHYIKDKNLGAESAYYQKLSEPYNCSNASFKTTEELLLIKGLTPDVFQRIYDYVTVYGDGKININSASKLVIESLSQKMDPALAKIIIDQRKIKPFNSVAEVQNVPGMTDAIYSAIKEKVTVSPSDGYYHVTSKGTVNHMSRTILAVLRKNTNTKNIEVLFYKEL
ncbi:MAG: general secretion pathway protein GspK [Planctomycetota bacterium]|nr:MAG: general secretion pathway protein GspK [Planctomycetota bacterium]